MFACGIDALVLGVGLTHAGRSAGGSRLLRRAAGDAWQQNRGQQARPAPSPGARARCGFETFGQSPRDLIWLGALP